MTCQVLRAVADLLGRWAPPVVVAVATRAPVAALTFDDGPDPATTPALLEVLAEHDAHATFFLIGERAARHPDLVRAIIAAGHEVGNHLWRDHPSVRLPATGFTHELTEVARLLEESLRESGRDAASVDGRVTLFRPGSGAFTLRMLRDAARLGHRCVLGSPWLVATTYRRHPARLGRRLGRRTHSGAIIVLHEGAPERTPVGAVTDALLHTLRERSLSAVTVTQLLAVEGD